MRKTFKIGERCYGGIVQLDVNGVIISMKILDYVSKKELFKHIFQNTDVGIKEMEMLLESEYTSFYWATQITKFLKDKKA